MSFERLLAIIEGTMSEMKLGFCVQPTVIGSSLINILPKLGDYARIGLHQNLSFWCQAQAVCAVLGTSIIVNHSIPQEA